MKRLALLAIAAAACRSSPRTTPPAALPPSGSIANTEPARPAAPVASEQARQLFTSRCAMCHGERGGGDGPAAASMSPKPNDFRMPAWQASVTDDQLRAIIVGGGLAVGKSPLMPGSPDLQDQPALVADLVVLIRSFAPTLPSVR